MQPFTSITQLNIGIIEDNTELRESIKDYFDLKDVYKIIFSVGNLSDLVYPNNQVQPDYILLDEHLENSSGIQAIRSLKKKFPSTNIVVITGDENPKLIVEALENGASGFLQKPFMISQIELVFKGIYDNGSYLQPVTTTKLIKALNNDNESLKEKFELLSKKEQEIAQFLIEGKSYKEIATIIKKTFHAVNYHIKNMYVKFGVNSKAELIYKLNN
jgi:DNA-binding NarL/FixJ family response regulator